MPFITTPERIGQKEGLREGLSQGIEVALRLKFGASALRAHARDPRDRR